MKTFALDVETTIYNKGDPFDQRNKLVLGGWGTTSSCVYFDNDKDQSITQLLAGASLVIGILVLPYLFGYQCGTANWQNLYCQIKHGSILP